MFNKLMVRYSNILVIMFKALLVDPGWRKWLYRKCKLDNRMFNKRTLLCQKLFGTWNVFLWKVKIYSPGPCFGHTAEVTVVVSRQWLKIHIPFILAHGPSQGLHWDLNSVFHCCTTEHRFAFAWPVYLCKAQHCLLFHFYISTFPKAVLSVSIVSCFK